MVGKRNTTCVPASRYSVRDREIERRVQHHADEYRALMDRGGEDYIPGLEHLALYEEVSWSCRVNGHALRRPSCDVAQTLYRSEPTGIVCCNAESSL